MRSRCPGYVPARLILVIPKGPGLNGHMYQRSIILFIFVVPNRKLQVALLGIFGHVLYRICAVGFSDGGRIC